MWLVDSLQVEENEVVLARPMIMGDSRGSGIRPVVCFLGYRDRPFARPAA